MKKIASIVLVSFLSIAALAGCNTVQGVGQDVQQGGKAIEKAAK
ncbi:entericidin A/B family lipoprotein [Lampropedia aestuarii]|uniref:Entericidin A/B family lipoprotein n=2 Tax=Lampropedia aestuarii TaxID=2562762 RepID=A0A4S5BK58_9BURK|nr:entericidin A/B family lipoprotein [Lampropedia aestuarii]MDH5857230.1 entericidin A/B family lipoprotein [Lampropedia aestuarii]THJ32867.1 entericidin A/B family lipoprotein [Lampropedia aestuarii]